MTSEAAPKGWTARRDWIFYGALAILLALMLVRVVYGMEWYGDEAYAMGTPMRYVHGDRPIVDSWESHFSSGMLLTPFMAVLMRLYPTGLGIVLGFRYLFVILQVLFVIGVWRTIRPLAPPWLTILAACTVFVYLPYFYVFPYYNNIAISLLVFSGLCLYRAAHEDGRAQVGFLIAAGILGGLGVIAYPTMLLALPFFGGGIAIAGKQMGERLAVKRALWAFFGALAAVLGAFAVVCLLASGIKELAAALPEFLDPVDRDVSAGGLVGRLLRTILVLVPAVLTLVATGLTLVIAPRIKGAVSRHSAAVATSVGVVTAVVVTFLFYKLRISSVSYLDMPQACALAVGLVLPLVALTYRSQTSRLALALLSLPALGVAVGTLPASHEGFETATMSALLALLATLFVLAELADRAREDAGGRAVDGLAKASVLLLLGFYAFTAMQYTGGDEATRQLTVKLTSGPYAGVHTTAANADKYAAYLKVLDPLRAEPGRIAFLEEFPQGYLLTGRRPGTYSVWTTFATGARLQRYLDVTGNYPTTIVATRFKGPNGGFVEQPFSPPFGIRDFAKRYRETFRDPDFVVYEQAH